MMAEQLCPVCGCQIIGEGIEKEGKVYCCEPCASGQASGCDCGCCHPVDKES